MTVEGKPVKPDSILGGLYKQGLNDAQRIADTLSVIIDATDKEAKTASNPIQQQKAVGSVADELGKLAELKNKGILTEEEFNEQKKKLLSDSVTSFLMTQFYTYLGKGMTMRASFRNATQNVREQYPEPYYWAGFVILD